MRFLLQRSIKQKLIVINVLVAGSALLCAFLVILIYEYTSNRNDAVRNLAITADVVGNNSSAALIFHDRDAAALILSGMVAEKNVTHASLFDADRQMLASYVRGGAAPRTLAPARSGAEHRFENGAVTVVRPVMYEHQIIGSIVIASDMLDVRARWLQNLLLLAGTLALALIVTWALAVRLQKRISGPILDLVGAMGAVSDSSDYSLRVEKRSDDEVGTLIDRFNDMLAQVHQRDEALREHALVLNRQSEELQEYSDRLERSNRELQDFASVASHDLQEPLRKVQAFSDRLVKTLNGQLDEQGHDYMRRMLNAVERMQVLINDLLAYSRITTKGQQFTAVDLGTVVREVVSDLEIRLEQGGHTVEVADLPVIDADALQMRQLFQNLIGNALKFHKPGQSTHVRIACASAADASAADVSAADVSAADVSAADGAQDDGHHASGRQYRLTVSDNGIGFDEKYSEQIFVIFQRLHSRSDYEGTGIGLAICRKIVDRHHGSIAGSGASGAGATFTILLPEKQLAAAS